MHICRKRESYSSQRPIKPEPVEQLTDTEIVDLIRCLQDPEKLEDFTDRLETFFLANAWTFDLEILRLFFEYYHTGNPVLITCVSRIILSICRSASLDVLEFLVDNGFHFLIWHWVANPFILEIYAQLVPNSDQVCDFLLSNEIIPLVGEMLLSDSELCFASLHVIASFSRSPETYEPMCGVLECICQRTFSSDNELAWHEALTTIGLFARRSFDIAGLMFNRAEFLQVMNADAANAPALSCLENILVTPCHRFVDTLSLEQRLLVVKFTSCCIHNDLVESGARVLRSVVNSSDITNACFQIGICQLLFQKLSRDYAYNSTAEMFKCVCVIISHGTIEHMQAANSELVKLLDLFIEAMAEKCNDEIVILIESFTRECAAHNKPELYAEFLTGISDAIDTIDLPDELREYIIDIL